MAENRYFIDGYDLYTTFGVMVTSGRETFITPRRRKPPFSHDWGDEDGIQYDLSNPRFESRNFKIRGVIVATSESDFVAKYTSFIARLQLSGYRTITITENNAIDPVYYAFYDEISSIETLTPIKNTDKIGMKFELSLKEFINSISLSPESIFDGNGI